MRKIKQGTRNVYDVPPEETPATGPAHLPAEMLEAAVRRYHILMICFCTLTIALFFVLAGMLYRTNRAPAPPDQLVTAKKQAYVPFYTLPKESQWVIDYEREAEGMDRTASADQPFSIEWVKYAAYHLIAAQQSMEVEQIDEAISHFEKALVIFPGLRGINSRLGTLYLRKGIPNKAVKHLTAARAEQPDYAVLNNLGAALMAAGQTDQAEETLLQAQTENPDHPGSYKNLALLYQATQQHDQALTCFEDYFAKNDRDVDAMQLYAEYLITLDKKEQAIRFLKTFSLVHAENGLPLYRLLAAVEAQEQNKEAAVEALKQITDRIRPTLALNELHRPEFDSIRESAEFQELIRQVELATVRLEEPR